jgi:anti-sigma regulatory factor (Ser/Thr protein kinase)
MRLVFDLAVSTRAPFQARVMLETLAADLDPETLGDLRIVVSELVSNAVKYGPATPVHVELDVVGPTRVSGVVADRGDPARAPRIHERPGDHGGYGMRLVDTLASAWGVREGSTDVWFELGG